MFKKKKNVDLTVGSPIKTIFLFAIPIMLGNVFQQLYNMVDSIVVGKFVGPEALGAVGGTFSAIFVFISVAGGVSIGCSVVTAQYLGAKRHSDVRTSITTGLIMNLVVSTVLGGVGIFVIDILLTAMNTPAETFAMSHDYLFYWFLGMPFMFMYNFISGIFRALGDSKTPLFYLIISTFINIVLDLVFVIAFRWGVSGVAIATFTAQGISMVLSFFKLLKVLNEMPHTGGEKLFDTGMLATTLRIALPSTMQQLTVSLSSMVFQAQVNSFGATVVSGYIAAIKIEDFAFIPLMNLGNSMSTFTAQNIGAGKIDRVKRGFRDLCFMCLALGGALGVFLYTVGPHCLAWFVDAGAGAEVISVGTYYLRQLAMIIWIWGLLFGVEGLLQGAGDMRFIIFCTGISMVFKTIAALTLIPNIGFSVVWLCSFIGGGSEIVIGFIRYWSGKWKDKAVVSANTQE